MLRDYEEHFECLDDTCCYICGKISIPDLYTGHLPSVTGEWA